MRLRLAAAAGAVLTAVPAFAQTTIVGDWDITINSPQGARQGKISLKPEGEKLTGMLKNQRGEIPLEGAVKETMGSLLRDEPSQLS